MLVALLLAMGHRRETLYFTDGKTHKMLAQVAGMSVFPNSAPLKK